MPRENDAKALERFSTYQLLQEVARRDEKRTKQKIPKRWCTDCTHFKFWTDLRREPPPDYNGCERNFVMKFRMGDDPHGDDTGFYRPGCLDFEPPKAPIQHHLTQEETRKWHAAQVAIAAQAAKPACETPRTKLDREIATTPPEAGLHVQQSDPNG